MATTETREPITIPCEGSGCLPCLVGFAGTGTTEGMCAMCGQWAVLDHPLATMPAHDRPDILRMLERGDYG